MKRTTALLLAVILLIFSAAACSSDNSDPQKQDETENTASSENNSDVKTDTDSPYEEGEDTSINLILVSWDGWGTLNKLIPTCELSSAIMHGLENANETGETVEKLTDEAFDPQSDEIHAELGTVWLETPSDIYRIDPNWNGICRVDGHYGSGKLLDAPEKLMDLISDSWSYYPYDYYCGVFKNRSGAFTLEHKFESESSVRIDVKRIELEDSNEPSNRIVLELISTKDETVEVRLISRQSMDNLAGMDTKSVDLKAGESTDVELRFGGWRNFTYWVEITAGNTKLNLEIDP
ncbi:MAG: hypothetical protein IKZ82_01025 [Clostridia bacterium]|nr:hypothetical protein [Clostridia bacterium]